MNSSVYICVGVITRNRPEMIKSLLDSYRNMTIPEGARVDFLIVENGERASLNSIVEDFRKEINGPDVHYLLEENLGIPFARNRALDFALARGHDYLTFVDDDEVVEPSWLVKLLAERDRGDCDIVGSPVRIAPIPDSYSPWEHMVWEGLNQLNFHAECRFVRSWQKGRTEGIRLATGSWLGRVAFFRETGLRFDTDLGFAGGEDWRLWEEARALGARTAWTPYAVAYETVPRSRLRLAYCYGRDRDHARMTARRRMKAQPARAMLRLPGAVLSRGYKCLLTAGRIPFSPGYGLVRTAFLAGHMVGLVQGTFGMVSNHYRDTSGA